MITHQRYLAMLTLSAVTFLVPSSAEAGPLFDWLFQRNRSQGLAAGNYTAQRPVGAPAAGSRLGCTSCLSNLFGGNRAAYANAAPANPNALANVPAGTPGNAYGTTAGYAPQGGCSSGWCQQTVVRWIPQTAYRTEYQSVPVTTYKTSTSINPANGLPLTCTRPCTTYSKQARRVPYTAYRPVYTTVPVADTWGQGQQQSAQPAFGQAPTYAYQPPSAPPANYGVANGGCANCQSGGASPGYSGYGNWSNVPGYTPGNATNLPPATAGTPWSNAPLAGPAANPALETTPWRSVDPRASGSGGAAAPWQSATGQAYDDGLSSGATDWQTVNPNGSTQPPPSQNRLPADSAPRLRPEYPDDYGWSTSRQESSEMPEYIRQRITGGTSSSFVPRKTLDSAPDTSYWDDDRNRRDLYSSDRDPYVSDRDADRMPADSLFRTPLDDGYTRSQLDPNLRPPANQRDIGDAAERETLRGIRDLHRLDRDRGIQDFNDKTARQRQPSSAKPLIQETSQTRYAATDIQWVAPKARTPRRPARDWRNDADRYRTESRRLQSEWTPIR